MTYDLILKWVKKIDPELWYKKLSHIILCWLHNNTMLNDIVIRHSWDCSIENVFQKSEWENFHRAECIIISNVCFVVFITTCASTKQINYWYHGQLWTVVHGAGAMWVDISAWTWIIFMNLMRDFLMLRAE